MTLNEFIKNPFWDMYKKVYGKDTDYLSYIGLTDDEIEDITTGFISQQAIFNLLNDALYSYEELHKIDMAKPTEQLDELYELVKENLSDIFVYDSFEFSLFNKG